MMNLGQFLIMITTLFPIFWPIVRGETPMVQQSKLNDSRVMANVRDPMDEFYRLPSSWAPLAYDLRLMDFNPTQNAHRATVAILLERRRTDGHESITLHSLYLQIHDMQLICGSQEIPIHSVTEDTYRQTVTFHLMGPLENREKQGLEQRCTLSLDYTFRINDTRLGPYRSQEPSDMYPLLVKFETTFARTFLPCFDEPALKARFTISIEYSTKYWLDCYSNMPIESEERSKDGRRSIVRFQRTPLMSTYTLAVVIRNAKASENSGFHISERTLMIDDKYQRRNEPAMNEVIRISALGEMSQLKANLFAKTLESTLKRLRREFDTPYPMPELRYIATRDFFSSAQENWGLIIGLPGKKGFRWTGKMSKKFLFIRTVIHETVHQWLGNLVTCKWWNDIWLNEGFAVFYTNLLVKVSNKYWAKKVESVKKYMIHDWPLSTEKYGSWFLGGKPGNPYLHGPIVIRMFRETFGHRQFRHIIRRYIQDYAYAAADSSDFIDTFVKYGQAGQYNEAVENFDVKTFMESWIFQSDYPVVTVQYDADREQLELEQSCRYDKHWLYILYIILTADSES